MQPHPPFKKKKKKSKTHNKVQEVQSPYLFWDLWEQLDMAQKPIPQLLSNVKFTVNTPILHAQLWFKPVKRSLPRTLPF